MINKFIINFDFLWAENCTLASGYIHNRDQSSCYKFYNKWEERTWAEASDFCLANDGELIRIDSEEKQTHIEEFLSK